MRLLDFRLDKFGPFTDHVLDLTEEGVHIIYGPNEAGKSSTLRAITHFFTGFHPAPLMIMCICNAR